MKNEINES
jgi:hypothetical protein